MADGSDENPPYAYGYHHPGESYHMIRGTGVTCRYACSIAMLGRRPILRFVLATKTRQALTENNIKRKKHIRARRNSSEGLPNDKYLQ